MSVENSLQPFVILYGVSRTEYFSSNSEVTQISHFVYISDYRKMLKRVNLTIGYPKNEPGTRRHAFEQMLLILEDHG